MDVLPITESNDSPGPSTSRKCHPPPSSNPVCKECCMPTVPTQFDTYGSVMNCSTSKHHHTLGNHIGLKDPITGIYK